MEGVQRKVLQGSSQQSSFETAQIKPNPGVGPLGASAGNPVSPSEAPKAPGRVSAKSTCKEQPGCASPALCPCREQQAGNTIPWPQCPSRDTLSLALHKLGEVIHGGDQPLPLPCLIAGRGVLGHLGRGFGGGRGVQLQGKARALVLCLFTELKGNREQVSSSLLKTLLNLHWAGQATRTL